MLNKTGQPQKDKSRYSDSFPKKVNLGTGGEVGAGNGKYCLLMLMVL